MSAPRHTPVKSAYDLVRAILKLVPDTRVNQGAKMVEAYVQERVAVVKGSKPAPRSKREANTTDHVSDASDPVRDSRNS